MKKQILTVFLLPLLTLVIAYCTTKTELDKCTSNKDCSNNRICLEEKCRWPDNNDVNQNSHNDTQIQNDTQTGDDTQIQDDTQTGDDTQIQDDTQTQRDTQIQEDFDPIELTVEKQGLPLSFGNIEHAEQMGSDRLSDMSDNFSIGVLTFQLFDQLAYRLNIQSQDIAREDARLINRIEDLMLELEEYPLFDNYVIVIDFFLLDRSYLVTWDGNQQRGPDDFGFWREDYRESITEQVIEIANRYTPSKIIIGSGINRLITMNSDDYSNFVALYRDLYLEIKRVSPQTEVGPSIDWAYLMTEQVPTFPGEREQKIEGAFELAVSPLLSFQQDDDITSTADFLGLSAVPDPQKFEDDVSKVPDDFFKYLRSLPEGFEVVYHKINWPIESDAYRDKQDLWLEKFLELNGGVNVSLVAWDSLIDFSDGTCHAITNGSSNRPTHAPEFVCHAGLWSVSGMPKDVYYRFLRNQ